MSLPGLIEKYGTAEDQAEAKQQAASLQEEGYQVIHSQEAASIEDATSTQQEAANNPPRRAHSSSHSASRAPTTTSLESTNDTIVGPTGPHSNTVDGSPARRPAQTPINFSRPVTPKKPGRQMSGDSSVPQYHRPLSGSPTKQGPNSGHSVIGSVSSLYQRSSAPPLAAPAALNDFRISPTLGRPAATQSPQAQVRQIEQARRQTLKRAKAAKRLNLMVIGQTHTGKTSFLRALLTTLGSQYGEIEVRRTNKMEKLPQVELAPSREVLLKGMPSQPSQKMAESTVGSDSETDHEPGTPTRRRRRKTRQLSTASTSTYFSSLGSQAPPQKLLLSLMDTPALPATMVHATGSEPPAPLASLLSELVNRYDASLAEERKLKRVPLQSGEIAGRHINAVVWMIEPREVLEGEWYRELEKQKKLDEKWQEVERRRRWTQDSKAMAEAQEQPKQEEPVAAMPVKPDASLTKNGKSSPKKEPKRPRSVSLHRRKSDGKPLSRNGAAEQGEKKEQTTDAAPSKELRRTISYGAHDRSGSESSVHTLRATAAAQAPKLVRNGSAAANPAEWNVNLNGQADGYIPNLAPASRAVLQHLLPLVPIIPVIARSDTLTVSELETVRRGVERGWKQVTEEIRRERGLEDGRGQFGWEWMGASAAAAQAQKQQKKTRGRMPTDEGVSLGEEVTNNNGVPVPTASPDKRMRSVETQEGSEEEDIKDEVENDTFPGVDDTPDQPRHILRVADVVPSDSALRTSWPLAIFSSEAKSARSSSGKQEDSFNELARVYPTHRLFLLDPSHCDFLILKSLLLGTHTGRILKASEERYEEWRRRVLEDKQGGDRR